MATQAGTQAYVERRSGWLTFVAVMMFAVGFARIVTAFTYFDDSSKVNNLAGSIFSDNLWAAGLWDLVVAALALFAGYSLLAGGGFGRFVAYVWGVFVIFQSFLTIGVAPWWSFTMIAVAVAVLCALSASGGGDEI